MAWQLSEFGFKEMMECRGRIRDLFAYDPPTLEDAAERAVQFLRSEFLDAHGAPACALVRFFKTHLYRDLPDDLQAVARAAAPAVGADPDLRCLTLIATRGDEPAWNSRRTSRGHRAIPLLSVEMVQQAPMIAQLITQLGVPIANVVRPSRELLLDQEQKAHNVFYVPRALGSPHIVAQEEFVAGYGIASVLGFGGLLASGDLFATIMFSKVPIPPEVADQFRVVGLNLKIGILPFVRKPVFRD
ncbi:MAG TPA: hypothetical protein VH087_12875 [Thermoanaerobaculia bacterium]|jgi:hypothetical protein|nr:hypothetical protein [Thermoanaerobaculia bacterium]